MLSLKWKTGLTYDVTVNYEKHWKHNMENPENTSLRYQLKELIIHGMHGK